MTEEIDSSKNITYESTDAAIARMMFGKNAELIAKTAPELFKHFGVAHKELGRR